MKKKLIVLLLVGLSLAACNSNQNSENMQDTTDTMGPNNMQSDTIDNGTMNHSADTLSNSTDSSLRQQP